MVANTIAAARTLLRNQPPDAVSVQALAAQSGYSPATMFRFFPDKTSVFLAVAEQIQSELRQAYQTELERHPPSSIEAAVNVLLDRTVKFVRSEPAWVALRWGPGGSDPRLRALFRETNAEVVDALLERFPALKRRRRHVEVAVESTGHLIGLAFESNPRGDRLTITIARESALHLMTGSEGRQARKGG